MMSGDTELNVDSLIARLLEGNRLQDDGITRVNITMRKIDDRHMRIYMQNRVY
jgi:hypothetical protein